MPQTVPSRRPVRLASALVGLICGVAALSSCSSPAGHTAGRSAGGSPAVAANVAHSSRTSAPAGSTSAAASGSSAPAASGGSSATGGPPTAAPTVVPGTIPAGAHPVAVSSYEFGTDDYHGAGHAMPGVVQFTTPSGNINCTFSTAGASVICSITRHDFAFPARPAGCTLEWTGLIVSDAKGAVLGQCVGGEEVTAHSHTLPYGDVLRADGIACYSGDAALTCRATGTGRGFALSRAAFVEV